MPGLARLDGKTVAGCLVLSRNLEKRNTWEGARWNCTLACGHEGVASGTTLLKFERSGKQYVCWTCAAKNRSEKLKARLNPNISDAKREWERVRNRERSARGRHVPGKSVSLHLVPKYEREMEERAAAELEQLHPVEHLFKDRPRTRGDCVGHEEPCPWVACRWHLYLDVQGPSRLKMNFPDLEPWDLKQTCALDVADAGGETLEEVGGLMNLTRERVRQLENEALHKLGKAVKPDGEYL